MAKLAFSKINKIKSIPNISYMFGENEIEVKQYLPLADKVQLMLAVIEQAGNNEEGFFNIVKLEAHYRIELIKAYTNITFTDKQLEDPTKIYDALILNDIWAFIEDKIPQAEREYLWSNIIEWSREITKYNNSILGVLKSVSQDYSNLKLDVNDIQQKITDPNMLSTLKEMLDKTGLVN